jgi:hypothetical protein
MTSLVRAAKRPASGATFAASSAAALPETHPIGDANEDYREAEQREDEMEAVERLGGCRVGEVVVEEFALTACTTIEHYIEGVQAFVAKAVQLDQSR